MDMRVFIWLAASTAFFGVVVPLGSRGRGRPREDTGARLSVIGPSGDGSSRLMSLTSRAPAHTGPRGGSALFGRERPGLGANPKPLPPQERPLRGSADGLMGDLSPLVVPGHCGDGRRVESADVNHQGLEVRVCLPSCNCPDVLMGSFTKGGPANACLRRFRQAMDTAQVLMVDVVESCGLGSWGRRARADGAPPILDHRGRPRTGRDMRDWLRGYPMRMDGYVVRWSPLTRRMELWFPCALGTCPMRRHLSHEFFHGEWRSLYW